MATLEAAGAAGTARIPAARRWYAHRLNHPVVYRLGSLAALALPRAGRLALARAVAAAAPFPRERAAVRANLARVVEGAAPATLERLVADVFRHFAMCFVDLITTNRSEPHLERLVGAIEGVQHLEAAAAEGRGTIILTAHLGNWELAGRLLGLRSARPTHVVVEAEPDPRIERFLRGGRAPVRFVARTKPTAAVPLLAALRRNEVVAMQGDRALGNRGDVAAPFFGAPAPFPLGPFVLARAAGAPLIPAFCALGPDRRYTIRTGEPIRVATDGERAALGRWVAALEAAVRRHPEQWFNFYDVWSASPVV